MLKSKILMINLISSATSYVLIFGLIMIALNTLLSLFENLSFSNFIIGLFMAIFICFSSISVAIEEYENVKMPTFVKIWFTLIYPVTFWIIALMLIFINVVTNNISFLWLNLVLGILFIGLFVVESHFSIKYNNDDFLHHYGRV